MMKESPSIGSAVATGSPSKPEHVLSTEQLVKIYGGRAVVNGVDLTVGKGEIVRKTEGNG